MRVAWLVLCVPALLNSVAILHAQPTTPATHSVPEWKLVEDLRIGDLDDEQKSFDAIRGIVSTRNGNIFVLDFKSKELRVFDATGKLVRRAARAGHGPGELEFPNGLAINSRDEVVASDPGNARFSFYSPDGKFLRQIGIPINGYGDFWKGVVDAEGRIIDGPFETPIAGIDPVTRQPLTKSIVRRIAPNGRADTLQVRCGEPAPLFVYEKASGYRTSLTMPYAVTPSTVLTSAGTMWCAASAEYRLSTGKIGTAIGIVVRKPVAPIKLSNEDRNNAVKLVSDFARTAQGKLVAGNPNDIPRSKPVIEQLFADELGRAWVKRSDLPRLVTAIDVFDANGRELANIRSVLPIGSNVVFVRGDHLYTVLPDADDVQNVVRYRIVKP